MKYVQGKTGVTADRDKIEFRLFNSSSIFNINLREELISLPKKNQIMHCPGFMVLVTWVKFLIEKLKVTIPLYTPTYKSQTNIIITYWHLTPSTQSNVFPKLIGFFYVGTHKVSTSIPGGSQVSLPKPCHEQVHSAHSSCTAPERVPKRLEFGWK